MQSLDGVAVAGRSALTGWAGWHFIFYCSSHALDYGATEPVAARQEVDKARTDRGHHRLGGSGQRKRG